MLRIFLLVLQPCMSPWLLSDIRKETFNMYFNFSINLLVFLTFDGSLVPKVDVIVTRWCCGGEAIVERGQTEVECFIL